ncbi:MAG TPA: hypothetical protein PLZ08_09375 [Bacillota bacterium]|nr:hypothetical protein [Bacillota bacterium]HOL09896.1 hypothetical protein [Bacillota bacterium]HPO98148.1 hypothetical protein [Bacillota bacterium]
MDQILKSSNWDNASFHERLNYYRKIEMQRAAAVGRKYCNIELIRNDSTNGYYDSVTNTIYINARFLTEPGTHLEGKEAIEHECTHADQNYFRNSPDLCEDPHIAVEYEIGMVVTNFPSLAELEKNVAIYLTSRTEREAKQMAFKRTVEAFQKVDRNDTDYKDYLELHKVQDAVEKQEILRTRPELISEEKARIAQYDRYQEKVNERIQILTAENNQIERQIAEELNKANYNNLDAITAMIDKLQLKKDTNAKEIERLTTERTFNPNLAEHFKTYGKKIEIDRFRITIDEMKTIKNEAIAQVKQDPIFNKLIGEVKKEKEELNRLQMQKEKMEKVKILKYIPFTKHRIKKLEEEIAGQQAKFNQKLTEAEHRSKELNILLKKKLEADPKYTALKEKLVKTKKNISEARTGKEHWNFFTHNQSVETDSLKMSGIRR